MAEKGQRHSTRIPVGGRPAGLMVQVTPAGSASWIYRIVQGGKRMERGLGAYNPDDAKRSTTLAQARKMAAAIKNGNDPVAERKGQDRPATFREVADGFLLSKLNGFKNDKHKAQWKATLGTWVYPIIGDKPVKSIKRSDVVAVLSQPVEKADGKPLWIARHETATRVRQRMERIFKRAISLKEIDGDNPAKWDEDLDDLLPGLDADAKRPKHHAALPYAEAPAFLSALRGRDGTAAKALQFTILTAARSGEVRNADWSEIDLERALWTIPASRMKADKEHDVPLSDAALAILTATAEDKREGLLFPGSKPDKPMSDMTLAAVLKRMERPDITVHGFRSTFREWAGETTSHPREVIEHALAHQLADKAEAAYQRGSLLPKRRKLMDDWSGYVNGHTGNNVVTLRGVA
ncbi:site-specific integrase [Sphingomonas sp. ABOLF]|nr:site-specific integrase [Sphingomonas sp. ABOLF]